MSTLIKEEISSEKKKDTFRGYLEQHGVIEKYTNIFGKLLEIETKPDNAIAFVQEELGENPKKTSETIKNLEVELEEQQVEYCRLKKIAKDMGLPVDDEEFFRDEALDSILQHNK